MARDDDFEPKLGRIRSRGSRRGDKYLHRVLRAVALAYAREDERHTRHRRRLETREGSGDVPRRAEDLAALQSESRCGSGAVSGSMGSHAGRERRPGRHDPQSSIPRRWGTARTIQHDFSKARRLSSVGSVSAAGDRQYRAFRCPGFPAGVRRATAPAGSRTHAVRFAVVSGRAD